MRIIEVDDQSEADILKKLNLLKSMLGTLRKGQGGKSNRDRAREYVDACKRIWDTDLIHLYGYESKLDRKRSYVYAHCDSSAPLHENNALHSFLMSLGLTHMPFYVGKGVGDRWLDINRNDTHRKMKQKLAALGLEIKPVILVSEVTSYQALAYESKLIDIVGLRINGGHLVNLDEGKLRKDRHKLYTDSLVVISGFFREVYGAPGKPKERKLLRVAANSGKSEVVKAV